MPVILVFIGLVVVFLVVFGAVKLAINTSEATRLLNEIRVLLMKNENEKGER